MKNYELVWEEHFKQDGYLNEGLWEYDLYGNGGVTGEIQKYTNSLKNVRVENGKLFISALKSKSLPYHYTSARLVTRQSWKYGKIEIRAKVPSGLGTWPAIWMLPDGFKEGDWPDCGEIDIMEHVAYEDGKVHFSLHTKRFNWMNDNRYTTIYDLKEMIYDFNTYILEWDEKKIILFVNGVLVYSIVRNQFGEGLDIWPFDKNFKLILNLAIGGWGGLEGIGDSWPQDFIIDYIKIYQIIQRGIY